MSNDELTRPEAIDRLKELVEDIDFAMMTTQDAAGTFASRPMSTSQMDDNRDLWFFTAEDTKKVDDIEQDHDLALSYADTKGMRYVAIAGRASVVHDRAKMEELYTPALDIWFEDGLDTPGIALLKVSPTSAEFWEPKHGKIVMAAGMIKALVTKDTPDDEVTRHEKLDF